MSKIEEAKNKADIVAIIGQYVQLKKDGDEWVGCCPFHKEKTPSFKVNEKKRFFKCFGGCDASGDVFDFLMKYHGYSIHDAVNQVNNGAPPEVTKQPIHKEAKSEVKWQSITPPYSYNVSIINHFKHGKPSAIWPYHNAGGTIVGYACRFDLPDGSKQVLPFVYATDGNRDQWRWVGFSKPRPLFNLHLITRNKDATILFVEGEKTAEAAQKELDPARTVVTTWMGGASSISHFDLTPVHGRKIILWPDNDVQGMSAMLHLRHLLGDKPELIKIVPLDTTIEKGWDAADKKWETEELRKYVLQKMVGDIPPNITEPVDEKHGKPVKGYQFAQTDGSEIYAFGIFEDSEKWKMFKLEQPDQPEFNIDETFVSQTNDIVPDFIPRNTGATDYFDFLGWEKNESGGQRYYFFSKLAKAVFCYSANALNSKSNVLTLAPLSYWEGAFPHKTKSTPEMAIEWLIQHSNRVGPFNPDRIRGRGAWMDDGRVVIHSGDQLIVNGTVMDLGSIDSRYIYERSNHLGFNTVNPLKSIEAKNVVDLCGKLNWERPINSYLLAGFCVIAPFCGALYWRPHIWLTGSAGTGKSWVFEKIVRVLLGETALAVQGETTEAGLRQTLRHDALPVVFDEVDVDDKRSLERIQNIISLMRSSSFNDGGAILKGSSNHASHSFKIRSVFAFASIGVQVDGKADRSRVTILSLKSLPSDHHNLERKARQQRWAELQKYYSDNITAEFVKRLQARTLKLLPVIIKNAQTFSSAAASHIGGQRIGDQLGVLLAGAYSLFREDEVTFEKALEWVKDKDWSEEKEQDSGLDERNLFHHIITQIVEVEGTHSKYKRSVAELLYATMGHDSLFVSASDADAALRRLGIKKDQGMIYISNSSNWIKGILRDTQWVRNHHKILLRLQNARSTESTSFAPGVRTRAVGIPQEIIEDTTNQDTAV